MGNVRETIESGKAVLGIEFGSTRIKAVLIDEKHTPIAGGSHEWENRYENGVWTYSLDDIWGGLTDCYASLKADVKEKYGVTLKRLGAIGFSAMMHGYMVFDKDGQLLVPFRTWRNSITEEASDELTSLFNYNIPQRWSIAHLYQAMLNNEEHLPRIDYMTTLEGFIHWKLTGKRVIGVGEASGMFPIDTAAKNYNANMVGRFDSLIEERNAQGDICLFLCNRQGKVRLKTDVCVFHCGGGSAARTTTTATISAMSTRAAPTLTTRTTAKAFLPRFWIM